MDPLATAARLYAARANAFAAAVNPRELHAALVADGMRRYDARLERHWQSVARFEEQVEQWDERRAPSRMMRDQRDPTAEASYRYWRGALRKAEARVAHLEEQHVTWEARVHRSAAGVVDAIAAFRTAAHASARAVTDELVATPPAHAEAIASALRRGATLFETTAFATFVQQPTLDAAMAWANELGGIIAPVAVDLPGNWSAVLARIRALPAIVTTALGPRQFATPPTAEPPTVRSAARSSSLKRSIAPKK